MMPDLSRSEPTVHYSSNSEQPSKANFNSLGVLDLPSPCPGRCLLLASKERELEVLRRQISALEEKLALGSAGAAGGIIPDAVRGIHRLEDDDISGEEGSLPQKDGRYSPPYGQLHDIEQESLPLQIRQLITLNKSRLYGPSHWTHGGYEVRKKLFLVLIVR